MKYHCGILSDDPWNDPSWVLYQRATLRQLSPEDRFEFEVWMSMPGFSINHHARLFDRAHATLLPYYKVNYDRLRPAVAENWISTTRDDCLKLASITRHKPLIVQLQAIKDCKSGFLTRKEAAKAYGVTLTTLETWVDRGLQLNRMFVPPGFELLTSINFSKNRGSAL